jgi:hypothetical protein
LLACVAICSTHIDNLNNSTLKLASLLSFDEAALPSFRPVSILTTSRPSEPSQQHFSHCAFLNFDLDQLSTTNNFKRLSNMLAQARTNTLKEKMQVLKDLYASRRYTQCANLGEHLLSEVDSRVRNDAHDAAYLLYVGGWPRQAQNVRSRS